MPPSRLHRLRAFAAGLIVALAPAATAFAQGFGGTVADHLVRGDSLLAQKKSAEAIIQFQEARTLCPTSAEIVSALSGEAEGHLLQNDLLPAAGLLEEAATRFPDDPRAANLLYEAGYASQSAGEYDKSIELFRKALASHPTRDVLPALELQFARTLQMRGKGGEAIDVLKDFEKDFPDHPLLSKALYQLALATHDIGTGNHDRAKLEEAAALHRRIIEKFPDRPAAVEAHFELGLILAELGRRAEAAESFNQYVALNPSSPVAAAALERAGDMTFLRSPKQSAMYYGLAEVKAKSNPKAPQEWGLSSWFATKRWLADALSRVWLVAIAGVVLVGAVALAVRSVLRRVRRAPAAAGAA